MRVVLFSLLAVSSLSARMKEARRGGTSHISILWVFDKILLCLELSRAKHCPVYAAELSNLNEIETYKSCFIPLVKQSLFLLLKVEFQYSLSRMFLFYFI